MKKEKVISQKATPAFSKSMNFVNAVCLFVVFFGGGEGGGLEPVGFCFAYKSPTDTSKHELFSPDGKKKCYSEILQKKKTKSTSWGLHKQQAPDLKAVKK